MEPTTEAATATRSAEGPGSVSPPAEPTSEAPQNPLEGHDLDETGNLRFAPVRVIDDYRVAVRSREASLLGWSEVFSGKAKFGIFGDGKEVAQLAMARAFAPGDIRSGYYRDQTFMLATGALTLEQWFAQLYAHADVEADPATAGRCMNSHFATRMIREDGSFKPLVELINSSADVSPTGSQMPRLVGLAQASKLYRQLDDLDAEQFSRGGREIAWGTIGNASCAEGMFWEAINAGGVLQVPMIVSIWDDGFGISVPNEIQVTKKNLSSILAGFQRSDEEPGGYDLYSVRGWDYRALCDTYQRAAQVVRREHVPAIIHVTEMTQPQGHSTSGSHKRYKTRDRLSWEQEYDPIRRMRQWILDEGLAGEAELAAWEAEDKRTVSKARDRAWKAYLDPIQEDVVSFVEILKEAEEASPKADEIAEIRRRVEKLPTPLRRDIMAGLMDALILLRDEASPAREKIAGWRQAQDEAGQERYNTFLFGASASALEVEEVPPAVSEESRKVNGFEVVNAGFDAALARVPNLVAFGEDLGRIGDVNQGFAGLQEKYGEVRVADTGIRECTILGQAIGLAMRGFRPLAEIQYLDYVLYALQIMSDDLATVQYRSRGGQKAPVIVRTRGHRLEGIWHSGSPMAGIIHLVRGMHVCVPRDMTRAAGFYNTLLQSDDPALVVEVLNGYRVKEPMPSNIGEMTVPLGVPEVLRQGEHVTVVTYGACCRIAQAAADKLAQVGIEAEILDVQTLLPFDRSSRILESLKRTNRVLFLDEDVPGGASAYMMQEVVEGQGAFAWLDSPPKTLSAEAHRPPYGSDGDYWAKPSVEDVFEAVYELVHEADPKRFPLFYRSPRDQA